MKYYIDENTERKFLQMLQNYGKCTNEDFREHLGMFPADVRRYVHALRIKGVPICSSSRKSSGYWIGSKEEIEETIAHLKSRIHAMREVVNALEKCDEEVFKNQIEMGEKDGGC